MMAKLNADRDVAPELRLINGRLKDSQLILHDCMNDWELWEADGQVLIKGTLREVYSFIRGIKYATEGNR